jgi:hypothetical protein
MAEFPAPAEGIALTHFVVASDVDRSRHFYADVLGGEVLRAGEPTIVALANGWIVINVGGGPTEDKPTVTLEPPADRDHVSSFLNIRVADIHSVYETWRAPGAEFLTHPPTGITNSAATCVTPTVTSSKSASGPTDSSNEPRCWGCEPVAPGSESLVEVFRVGAVRTSMLG